MKHRNNQVWMRSDGSLSLILWNYCGCCPNDVLFIYGPKQIQRYAFCGCTKIGTFIYMAERGWTRIQ